MEPSKQKRQDKPWKRCLRFCAISVVVVLVAGCSARSLFFQGPYQAPAALPQGKLTDVHCHVAGIGAGGTGCFVSTNLQKSYKFDIYLKSFGVTREQLASGGDALIVKRVSEQLAQSKHVGKAVVLAMDGVINGAGELDLARTEIYIPNEYLAKEVAKYTNLLFGASINPYRRDAMQRLEWVHSHGAKLIKWIPSIQSIDPGDEKLVPFYRRMAALRMPLLTHAGQERSFTHADDSLADPEKLRLPLKLGVTVIAAHIASTGENAGERDTDRLRRLFAEYPNLYSEISSLTQINKLGYLREALTQPEFSQRLLYGTDFPLINMVLVSPYYFPLNLTWRQMREISKVENPWDRDVLLKQALGVPPDIFSRTANLLP